MSHQPNAENLFFYEFQNYHISRITQAGSELKDPSVSAIARGKTWSDLVEQAFDHLVIAKFGCHQTTGIHLRHIITVGAVARNRNEALRLTTDRVRLGARGLNTLVDKQLLDKVPTERVAGAARPSKSIT
jgi:hypothetical protein